jgi:hypothetical protein
LQTVPPNSGHAKVPCEVRSYWENLTEAEREDFERRAVANATGFIGRQYRDGKERGGALFLAAKVFWFSLIWKKPLLELAGQG